MFVLAKKTRTHKKKKSPLKKKKEKIGCNVFESAYYREAATFFYFHFNTFFFSWS